MANLAFLLVSYSSLRKALPPERRLMSGPSVANQDCVTKIIVAGVITGSKSFMEWSGTAQVRTQSLYSVVKKFMIC